MNSKSLLRLLPFVAVSLASCAVSGGDSAWNGPHGSAFLGGFYSGLSGDLRTTDRVGPVKVKGTANMDSVGQGDDVFNPSGGVRLGFAPFEVGLSMFDYAETGSGKFTGRFLGKTFTGKVRSDFDVRNIKGTAGLDLWNSEQARIAVVLGVDYLDMDLLVQDLGTKISERIDEALPIPVVGVRGDVRLIEDLRLAGEFVGMDLKVEDFNATFFDLELALLYQFSANVEAFVGYRDLTIDFAGPLAKNQTVDANLGLSGPIFGVGLRF